MDKKSIIIAILSILILFLVFLFVKSFFKPRSIEDYKQLSTETEIVVDSLLNEIERKDLQLDVQEEKIASLIDKTVIRKQRIAVQDTIIASLLQQLTNFKQLENDIKEIKLSNNELDNYYKREFGSNR